MRTYLIITSLLLSFFFSSMPARAQVQELEELALDVEKLAQFKTILSDMYKGYQILSGGYNTIKDISQGNFSLHKAFLDGLLSVNPTIKKYSKVANILLTEETILKQYKSAFALFKSQSILAPGEMSYISTVYSHLVDESTKNLESLLTVITDNKLRMSDAERILAIDHINDDMNDKLDFLMDFNSQAGLMSAQRQKSLDETGTLNKFFGTKN